MAKILLIEDNLDLRESLKEMLLRAKHQVLEAGNGDQGLNIFIEEEPDIVITDILMPECDGIEFLHSLAALRHDIPIVCMSGGIEGDTSWIDQLTSTLGAVHLLKKPFSREELINIVDLILAR